MLITEFRITMPMDVAQYQVRKWIGRALCVVYLVE